MANHGHGYIPTCIANVTPIHGNSNVANAAALRLAYAQAAASTPGGNALSATNRACVFIPPGVYDFGVGNATNHGIVLDAEFVDLVGLGASPEDVQLTSAIITASRGTVEQTADDVHISDLTMEMTQATYTVAEDATDPAAYFPGSDLSATKLTNVVIYVPDAADGFSRAMRTAVTYSGTYTDVDVKSDVPAARPGNCFGGVDGPATGTFIRCACGPHSYADHSTASGSFTDCIGGNDSFAFAGTASGTFKRCTAGIDSFSGWTASNSTGGATGTFTDCVGGSRCFGAYARASGTFKGCTGGTASFGGGDGQNGAASGVFTDCVGGLGAWSGFYPSGKAAVMRRCVSTGRATPVTNWQGLMEGCTIGVTTAGQSAVGLASIYIGAAARLATGGTTGTIVFTGNNYRAEFPVGSWIYHPTSLTWHTVSTVVYTAGATTVTMADAAADTWDAETVIAAWKVGRVADAASDTDTIVFAGVDYRLEFPVGTWIYHPTSTTWHRVASVAFATNTTVEMADAAGAAWDAEIVHPTVAARIYDNTLATVDTEAVDSPIGEAPAMLALNRMNVDVTANVKNQVGTPGNIIDVDITV